MCLVAMREHIKEVGNGFYDRFLGKNMKSVMYKNEPQLREYFKKKHDMDLKKTLDEMPDSGCLCNEIFTTKMFGYESEIDYYAKTECKNRIPNIEKPTLFVNALDDPIIGDYGIDFEGIRGNKNTILATTHHGGHLAYEESVFSTEQWYLGPALDFLNIFRYF